MPITCQIVLGFGNSEINKIPFKLSSLKRSEPALLPEFLWLEKEISALVSTLHCELVILPLWASIPPEGKA